MTMVNNKTKDFFLEYISIYDKSIKTIPENKLEEDTIPKKQKSSEAEPTAK